MIKYPSLSICKKFSIEYALEFHNGYSNNTNKAVRAILYNTYDLEQQIYFFTHPGVNKLTFPCTTNGGYRPGAPCIFPIIWWNNKTQHKCFDMGKSKYQKLSSGMAGQMALPGQ